jgi:hypothetical protein
MLIPDPCGSQPGYQRIVGQFIKSLMIAHNCRSSTAKEYGQAVNLLFEARDFRIPADFGNKNNISYVIYENLKTMENVANQRQPLTTEMFAMLREEAEKSTGNSATRVVFDFACVNRYLGCRSSEYAQKVQTRVEVHVYPDGTSVIKAFTREDWIFYDKRGRRIMHHSAENFTVLSTFKARFRIQKNRQNGQRITVTADASQIICPVHAAYRIYLRSIELGIPPDQPMAVFSNHHSQIKYLTTSKITEVLQNIARMAHPDWPQEDIKKIGSHSFRVWALVLLAEAGKKSHEMKNRLRWLGESFRLYLRDTAVSSRQHSDAMKKTSDQFLSFLSNLAEVELESVPEANLADTGNYSEFD